MVEGWNPWLRRLSVVRGRSRVIAVEQTRQAHPRRVRLPVTMWALSSSKSVRFALASMLSLWVAGAGCMLGCEGMASTAAASPGRNGGQHSGHKSKIVAFGHACSSGKSHDCCKQTASEVKPNARRPSSAGTIASAHDRTSSGMMKSCPLALSRAAVVTKARGDDSSVSPTLAHSTLPSENFLEQTASLSIPLRLPNRGHTYLRCCVFLI